MDAPLPHVRGACQSLTFEGVKAQTLHINRPQGGQRPDIKDVLPMCEKTFLRIGFNIPNAGLRLHRRGGQ